MIVLTMLLFITLCHQDILMHIKRVKLLFIKIEVRDVLTLLFLVVGASVYSTQENRLYLILFAVLSSYLIFYLSIKRTYYEYCCGELSLSTCA